VRDSSLPEAIVQKPCQLTPSQLSSPRSTIHSQSPPPTDAFQPVLGGLTAGLSTHRRDVTQTLNGALEKLGIGKILHRSSG